MAEKMVITVTKQHNGVLLSAMYGGQYVKKLYQGYTVREAKQDFRKYVKSGGRN